MNVTIFYAWQADRPEKANRDLIRNSAKSACQRITQDSSNDWCVTVDSDTQGVAGMCDIPNVILQKIRNSDIFLGDMTLVGAAHANPDKLFPNANVVFELGYAARHLGFKALVGVINESYGTFDGQIFDIKRRGCLKYKAKETGTSEALKRAENRLSNQLEAVFRSTIESVVLPRRTARVASHNESTEEAHREFAERVRNQNFHGFELLPAVVTSVQFSHPAQPDFERAFEIIQAEGQNPTPDGEIIFWPGESSMAELNVEGHLVRAFGGDYKSVQQLVNFNSRGAAKSGDVQVLFDETVQRNIVRGVYQQCQLLTRIGARPPWYIGVSLVGVKGFRLLAPSREASPTACSEDILHLPQVIVQSVEAVADSRLVGNTLQKPLKFLSRKFGWPYNLCFTEAGEWNLR